MNGVEINADTLLFGNDFLSDETNCEICLKKIQRYIKDTGSFFSIIVTNTTRWIPLQFYHFDK